MSHNLDFEKVEKRLKILEKENADLREFQKAISASEKLHRTVIENISDTVIITDDHGKFVYVCPNTHIIFGLSPAEVYQLGTIQALVKGIVCDISELKQKNEIENIEWSITDTSGSEHFLLINAKSVNIQGGTNLYTMRDITELKQALNELYKERNLAENLIQTAQVIILLLDTNGHIVRFNPYLETLSGYILDEVKGKDWFSTFLPPANIDKIKNLFQNAIDDIQTRGNVNPIIAKDGREILIEWHDKTLKDTDGNTIGLVSIGLDVTERKQIEEKLRKNEILHREAQRVAKIGHWEIDSLAGAPVWSEEIFHIFGLDPKRSEPSFTALANLIHAEDWNLLNRSIQELSTNGTPFDIEFRILRSNGEIRWMHARGSADKAGDGSITRMFGTAQDVSDRKQAEESLRESEEKYRLLVENANDAIFIAQDEVIKFPNPKTIEIIGYSEDELLEIPFIHLIHPEDREMVIGRYLQRLKGETPPSSYSFKIINKAGDEVWVQLNAALITWEGRPATINLIRDITEQKHLENQLRHSQKMESIGTLAGGIAHDFNNILGIILGNTELAMDDVPNWNPARLNLEEVRTASLRAKDVVRQLLSFARKTKLKKKPTNIAPIVKESLKLLRSYIPTDIDIRHNIPENIETILADPTQINQILINLFTNSHHAMPDGGIIEVTLENLELDEERAIQYPELQPGRYVHLSVSDTGQGIFQKNIDHIFDPYFTTKDVGKGTGMGLAVVHGIVKNHNGVITVQSTPGKGTTFDLLIPAVENEPVVEIGIDEDLPAGHERILLIDDEEPIVRLGRQRLEKLGYNVEAITNPIEALAMFKSKPDAFDLAITDMTMPNMTGDRLAKELLIIRPDIPIIICTGFSEKMSPAKAQQLGIKAFLMKPVEKTDLAKIVRKVLDAVQSKA